MIFQSQNVDLWVKLIVWIGGVLTTAGGALFASRVRVYEDHRKAHLDELKQRVLVPTRDGLEHQVRPLVFNLQPLVKVIAAAPTEFHENAKATESQIEQGDLLQATFPGSLVFGSVDSVLLRDAQKTHFTKQMAAVDKFVTDVLVPAVHCHVWVRQMAQTILAESHLPAFPNRERSVRGPAPYVMHFRLAVFVYKRLFRFSAPALESFNLNDGSNWALNGEDATLACGSEEQVTHLVERINMLLAYQKGQAETLLAEFAELQKSFQELISELDYAIATRRLRKRCDLVPFSWLI